MDWKTMKCPTCKKDFNQAIKAAYKLGLQDGENQYHYHLNLIEKTTGNLFRQLRIMDLRSPDKVNCVYFSREYLGKLCKILGRNHLGRKAKEIKNIINKQLGETLSAEVKLRELLSEIEEEE